MERSLGYSMKTILIIDDDPLIRESLKDVLESSGFQAITASNGMNGLRLASQQQPDLILCDVQMPNMDGYAVLSKLRQTPAIQTIPFIFLTGRSEVMDLRQGMNLGADDYLSKPCGVDELLAALNSRLAKQEVLQAQAQKELDSLRSSIAMSLPHEFRTPLTGIFTSVELLRLVMEDSANAAEILSIADTIQTSARRLYRLIQNFLLYAKLEVAVRDPHYKSSLLYETTLEPETAIATLASQLVSQENRGADLHLALQNAGIAIPMFDLEKIMTELIDNAIKFSVPNSPIEVVSTIEPEYFHLQVRNQGIGMTAAQIAALGAYKQFDRQIYEQQGVGLGLAIVQRLVELRDGYLTIDSVPDDSTTVHVFLPLADLTKQLD